MSQVSNRHNVLPFISGESKPLNGQRLAKVGYKQTKKMQEAGEVAPESICVSLPKIPNAEIETHWQGLIPHVRTLLETAQDGIIRSLYEGKKCDRAIFSSVSDEELNVSACIAFLESEASGGRLSKEYLESWFDKNLNDNLFVVIAEKLGFNDPTDAQTEVVMKHLAGYKALIAGMSGKNLSLQQSQITGIRRALEVCSVDDETSEKLIKKLDEMEQKKVEQLLAL